MSRKDMIIVAALINAGLLVVLFVTAVKPKSEAPKSSFVSSYEPAIKNEVAAAEPLKKATKGDQIDQVISEYNVKAAQKKKKGEEAKPLSLPVLTPQSKTTQGEAPLVKKQETQELPTVTVTKGDVLERIAKQHGASVQEIMKLNKLSNTRLQIGQVLKLPPKTHQTAAPKKEVPADGSKFYVVRPGDNPWTIASKNGMQVEELLELNKMDEEKAKRLRPGDRLKIK